MSAANNTAPNAESAPLDWALYYAEVMKWPVCPLHTPIAPDGCSCGKDECIGTRNRGKHPRTDHGLKDATTDPDTIRAWWTRWPDANIAIRTDGLTVIDIDYTHGGLESLEKLEAKYGKLPATLFQHTAGNGGEHRVYIGRTDKNTEGHIAKGIDSKTNGGYIVVEPSLGISGNLYRWDTLPGDTPLPEIPTWVADLIKKPKLRLVGGDTPSRFEEGTRNASLYGEGFALRKRGYSEEEILNILLLMNRTRCTKPLSEDEVRKIAKSAATRPPGNAAPKPTVVAGEVIEPGEEWRERLQYVTVGGKDQLKNTFDNVVDYLMFHPDWKGVIALDRFAAQVMILKEFPSVPEYKPSKPGQLVDTDYAKIKRWLTVETNVSFSKEHIIEAVELVAEQHSFDPLQDHLNGLVWDRVPRIQEVMTTYFGAPSNNVNRFVGKAFMISAIARALEPGCKVDTLLVLEGPQGKNKSTAIEKLCEPWFSDTKLDLESKDAMDNIRGKWVIELGELASLRKEGDNQAKNFFSSRADDFRPAYARKPIHSLRRCVFIGTTNHREYLTDKTGGRRYWSVETGRIDLKAIERDRDQLWAEAVACYRAGEKWYVPDDHPVNQELELIQSSRYMEDAWQPDFDRVISELKGKPITLAEALLRAVGICAKDITRGIQIRAGACMARGGCKYKSVRIAGQVRHMWV